MSFGSVFADMQNFRFRPSSIFEPIGSEFSLHRLWKVKFLGCLKSVGVKVDKAVWKFFGSGRVGLAWKPYDCRQNERIFRKRSSVKWLLMSCPSFALV